MIAKLVTAELTIRVVVDENADDSDIIEMARHGMEMKLRQELPANVTEISDDTEFPYEEEEQG